MYDKLGEMLNEALESGKIPADDRKKAETDCNDEAETGRNNESDNLRHCEAKGRSNPEKQNDQFTPNENGESGHFSFKNTEKKAENARINLKNQKKEQIPTGEVIKLHKYTYNMQFPPQIQSTLTALDIAYPFTNKDITAAYHKKLKEVHPDTQNTIQSSQTVQNNRHLTIDNIRNSYQILCDFFGIKQK